MRKTQQLHRLQGKICYQFKQVALLERALTHRSYSALNYERYEFLGDAILSLVISDWLYNKFTDIAEGDLSRVRASLVNQDSLFEIAQQLNLADCLLLGEGEIKSGGRSRSSILADVVESIIAAVYLDSGFVAAQQVVLSLFKTKKLDSSSIAQAKDAKSQLQEYMQQHKKSLPIYRVKEILGAEHQQTFVVECCLTEFNKTAVGTGVSRRAAEQQAAQLVLQQIMK